MEQNHLCNFERGHHGEHSSEVNLNLDQWFRGRCHLKKKFTDEGGQTHGGRRTKTRSQYLNLELSAQVS